MGQVIITSSLLTLVMAIVAVFMTWGCLRVLDILTGFDFRSWVQSDKNDIAVAIYLGARFIGACLLVGMLFS